MNERTNIWSAVDWWTVVMFLALALFGWINIYGACYTFEQSCGVCQVYHGYRCC